MIAKMLECGCHLETDAVEGVVQCKKHEEEGLVPKVFSSYTLESLEMGAHDTQRNLYKSLYEKLKLEVESDKCVSVDDALEHIEDVKKVIKSYDNIDFEWRVGTEFVLKALSNIESRLKPTPQSGTSEGSNASRL
jgi:hypothetical protein